jgi:hypothetical protein
MLTKLINSGFRTIGMPLPAEFGMELAGIIALTSTGEQN